MGLGATRAGQQVRPWGRVPLRPARWLQAPGWQASADVGQAQALGAQRRGSLCSSLIVSPESQDSAEGARSGDRSRIRAAWPGRGIRR